VNYREVSPKAAIAKLDLIQVSVKPVEKKMNRGTPKFLRLKSAVTANRQLLRVHFLWLQLEHRSHAGSAALGSRAIQVALRVTH